MGINLDEIVRIFSTWMKSIHPWFIIESPRLKLAYSLKRSFFKALTNIWRDLRRLQKNFSKLTITGLNSPYFIRNIFGLKVQILLVFWSRILIKITRNSEVFDEWHDSRISLILTHYEKLFYHTFHTPTCAFFVVFNRGNKDTKHDIILKSYWTPLN